MQLKLRRPRADELYIFALVLITGIIFGIVYYDMIILRQASDYVLHLRFARFLLNGQFTLVHVLFHLLVIAVQALPLVGWEHAAWIVTIATYSLTVTLIYAWLRTVTRVRLVGLIGALVLITATPITLLTWYRANLYLAYIGVNIVHSPTMVLLKAFSLPVFIGVVLALEGKLRFSARNVLIGAGALTLSLFSKPNFALVLLPALLVVIAYRYARSRSLTGVPLVTVGLIVPMLILLPLQYALQYALGLDESGVKLVFAPLMPLFLYDQSLWWIGVKLVMSLAFPLAFTLLYRKTVRLDTSLTLGWWLLIMGMAQMYLFAESGIRFKDGNFWWGAQIALWLLFIACARLFIQHFKREPRAYITAAILALHTLSGVIYLIASTAAFYEYQIW